MFLVCGAKDHSAVARHEAPAIGSAVGGEIERAPDLGDQTVGMPVREDCTYAAHFARYHQIA